MSKIGQKIISSLKEAKKKGLTTIQVSPDVAKLRKKLKLTQSEFAIAYRINLETLRKWEQHQREPDSISRAYLKCIQKAPLLIRDLLNQ